MSKDEITLFNISDLGDLFIKDQTFTSLGGKIKQYRSYHSIKNDLEICQNILRNIENKKKSSEEITMDFSLCIILYVRAIKTESKYRASSAQSFILERIKKEKKLDDHKFLCRLRDHAVAHYGAEKLLNEESLNSDAAFMILDQKRGCSIIGFSQLTVPKKEISILEEMVSFSLNEVTKKSIKLNSEVNEEFSSAFDENKKYIETILGKRIVKKEDKMYCKIVENYKSVHNLNK